MKHDFILFFRFSTNSFNTCMDVSTAKLFLGDCENGCYGEEKVRYGGQL